MKLKYRDSNLELLRIIAMFFVLVVHADFFSLSTPTIEDINENPDVSFMRFFVESMAIVCVNVFVLISGWYGIRPSIKRFLSFVFQVLFFSLLLYFFFQTIDKSFLEWLMILGAFNYWFVKAYIVLYILSPILNAFIENTTQKQFGGVLLSFFLIEWIYGWYLERGKWFDNGYSPLSFIGLYLLARYLRKYCDFRQKAIFYFIGYLFSVIVISLLAFYAVEYDIDVVMAIYAYNAPWVIIASILFFLFFVKLEIKESKIINMIASSAFSVYLFHGHECLMNSWFVHTIKTLYVSNSFLFFVVYALGFLSLVFLISILLDRVRILLWSFIIYVGLLIPKVYGVKNGVN